MINLPKNTMDEILAQLDTQEVLSLYEGNKLHSDKTFVKTLQDKYTEALYGNQLYLYQMEDNLILPNKNNKRLLLIDMVKPWMVYFGDNMQHFCLAIHLMDSYNATENVLCVLFACIRVTFRLLNDYDIDDGVYMDILYDYQNLIINKGFKLFTEEELIRMTTNLFIFFDVHLIRPSTIFYANKDNFNLCLLSYYSNELIIYKPSMIYETVNYILTGQYHIYTLNELMPICNHLINLINFLAKSNYNITTTAQSIKTHIKYKCYKNNISMAYKPAGGGSLIPAKYNQRWEFGEHETVSKINDVIIRIRKNNIDYVIKKVENVQSAFVEIACLKLLNHPNIIHLYGFDMKDHIYLYLPYYANDLSSLLEILPLNKKYIYQLLSALDHCHFNDIIHRDIKPQNIIYDEEHDLLKLIDFGQAVTYATHRVLDPNFAATLLFRAPEALLGKNYTKKIDVWAIGLVFYMMMTGQYLFTGNSPKEMLDQISHYKPLDDHQYNQLINMCLTIDPMQRPDTNDLLKWIEQL